MASGELTPPDGDSQHTGRERRSRVSRRNQYAAPEPHQPYTYAAPPSPSYPQHYPQQSPAESQQGNQESSCAAGGDQLDRLGQHEQLGHPDEHKPGSTGEHQLQQAYGTTKRADRFYNDQMLDHLNEDMMEFVGRMDMAFVATADANGEADCSFRAGPAGFIQVLDNKRIAYPEYRGNGVMASLGNIAENPHIGVMLLDFTRDQIGLHINGRARIVEDDQMRAEFSGIPTETVRGRVPERWVVVEVAEAYIHCRKHIPRLVPMERQRAWGTDDTKRKGGDYFNVRRNQREEQADQTALANQATRTQCQADQSSANGS
ncbi:hypothetical protein F8178_01320 [Haloechinothrix sp. LS1_15]|nr:hypothetical protein [Haloechinothrix sp. LS1_15]